MSSRDVQLAAGDPLWPLLRSNGTRTKTMVVVIFFGWDGEEEEARIEPK